MCKLCSFHGLTRNVENALYILFLPVANPEILHIGNTALYDNTSPT